jgi:hypothetical protein
LLLLRVELVADDHLDQPVHAQPLPILAGLDQRVATQRPDSLLVGKRVTDGAGELFGQQLGVLGGQVRGMSSAARNASKFNRSSAAGACSRRWSSETAQMVAMVCSVVAGRPSWNSSRARSLSRPR